MADRLPSLRALRAFEAAARHMSFAKAAEELFVTPAALSFQIKSLETELGQPLFHRLNRAVALTEAGEALAPGTTEGFERLLHAWRAADRMGKNDVLTITAGPAFTAKWLAPRMYQFALAHPDIELRFSASLKIVDLNHTEVDAAIRFGLGNDKDVYARPLAAEWLTPMMTPDMFDRIGTDLSGITLIHDDSISFLPHPMDWGAWSRLTNADLDFSHGPRFSNADHALDAAIAGAGVALARASLSGGALDSGQLVAPFDIGILVDARYRFICPKGAETRPQIQAFEEWLLSQIAASTDYSKGRNLVAAADIPAA